MPRLRSLCLILLAVSLSASATSLASAGVASLSSPVKLAWQPKAGAQTYYSLLTIAGEQEMRSGFTQKVKEVKNGRVTIEHAYGPPEIALSGASTTLGDGGTRMFKYVFGADGEPLSSSISNEHPMGKTIRQATSPRFPNKEVNEGDSWKVQYGGAAPGEATFVFKGSAKIGQWDAYQITIKYQAKGSDLSASGTFFVAASDGSVIKSDVTLNNLPTGVNLDQKSQFRHVVERQP